MDDRSDHFDRVDCTRVAALAPTFVDGEVRPEALASAVRKHLIDCAAPGDGVGPGVGGEEI